MRKFRLMLMIRLYTWSSQIYARLFKSHKEAWGLSKEELAAYEEGTLGNALGRFYALHGFDVMPKLENHDVFHVLTGTGVEIQDEVSMQFLLLGNGKFSLYLFGMIGLGSIIFPEFITYYIRSFQRGRSMDVFHHLEFRTLLNHSLTELQDSLLHKSSIINI